MSKEKSLDEALDEMDKWGDKVSDAIASLGPDELSEYFRRAQADLETLTGQQLKLRVRPTPPSRVRKPLKAPSE